MLLLCLDCDETIEVETIQEARDNGWKIDLKDYDNEFLCPKCKQKATE